MHVRRVPNMHALTADGANEEEAEESRLPAPEQPLLTRLTEAELAEEIEPDCRQVEQSEGQPVQGLDEIHEEPELRAAMAAE